MRYVPSIPWRNPFTVILISFLAALLIQALPVWLKARVDDLFTLNAGSFWILASLCFAQMAITLAPGRLGRILGSLILSVGLVSSLCNVMNIAIFKSPVSIITLATTLQSNPQEVHEFLSTYGSRLVSAGGLYSLTALALLALYRRASQPFSYTPLLTLSALAMLSILPLLAQTAGNPKHMGLAIHELSYADRLLTTAARYQSMMEAREKAKAFWTQRADLQKHLALTKTRDLPPVVLVVIGESTTRRHMQLYGYHRETTPRLAALKDQLLVFQDTTAPIASTLPGVIGALCAADFDPHSLECRGPTLIEIARAAGYRTTWISNQAPGGFGDNFIVELGRTTDENFFVNQDVSSAGEADNNSSYDTKVLEPLDEMLTSAFQDGSHHMIFIHLMGTHFIYEKRYPQDQAQLTSRDDIRLPEGVTNPKARMLIHHYDNAVAAQDKLLASIIERLNASGRDGLFVYFSDHGEEVYNTDDFAGHSEDRVTPAMREVPFIVAYSQSYAEKRSAELEELRTFVDRPLSTFQLTPTLAGLLGLESETFRDRDNVFSKTFQPDFSLRRASSATRAGSSKLAR